MVIAHPLAMPSMRELHAEDMHKVDTVLAVAVATLGLAPAKLE
jgi:hypothetical protein